MVNNTTYTVTKFSPLDVADEYAELVKKDINNALRAGAKLTNWKLFTAQKLGLETVEEYEEYLYVRAIAQIRGRGERKENV